MESFGEWKTINCSSTIDSGLRESSRILGIFHGLFYNGTLFPFHSISCLFITYLQLVNPKSLGFWSGSVFGKENIS